jgi:hypothetical protein
MDTRNTSTISTSSSKALTSFLLTLAMYLIQLINSLRRPTVLSFSYFDMMVFLLLTYCFPHAVWYSIKIAVIGALGHLFYGLWALRFFEQYAEERLPLFQVAGWEITVRNGKQYLQGTESAGKTLKHVAWILMEGIEMVGRSFESGAGMLVRLVVILGKNLAEWKKAGKKGKVVVYSGIAGDLAGLDGTESVVIREEWLKGT